MKREEEKKQHNKTIPFTSKMHVPQEKVLVLAPHPDDEVFGCGGAIIRHIRQGDDVKVIIVTDGGLPVNESQNTQEYPEIRKQESLTASKVLSYGQPHFLDFKDGFLKADEKLIARLLQIIIDFEPQNIYLPSDTEIHPDHLALNKAGIEAAKRFAESVNLFFYEIGQPLSANFFLDITDLQPTLDLAMDCFESQLAAQDYKTQIRSLHAYRSYTLGKNVKFAEAYRLIKSHELKTGEVLWQESKQIKVAQPPELKTDDDFPLISIIVRTMNRPQLPEALESIAAQTYPNIEVIVVDARGKEPLHLGNTCGQFPLRLISIGKPLNRPEAGNAGLEAVKGAYFGFLDDDDLFFPQHIENLLGKITKCDAIAVYDSIEKVSELKPSVLYESDYDPLKLYMGNYIPNMAFLFKSGLISEGVKFDTTMHLYEDWDFNLQAATKGLFVSIKEKGGIYRDFDYSGIHNKPELINHYRKEIYKKWLPLLGYDKITDLLLRFGYFSINEVDQLSVILYKNKELKRELEKEKEENEKLREGINLMIDELRSSKVYKLLCLIRNLQRPFFKLSSKPLKKRSEIQKDILLLNKSHFFDCEYYLQNNPDVKEAGMNPVEHYLLFGGFEGRDPSSKFNSKFYLMENHDVKVARINPLIHYIKTGKLEGRSPKNGQ